MIDFDTARSLQELEKEDWGEPDFGSHLAEECHRLRRVPLKEFSVENLRIMIGQNIGSDYLVPLALEILVKNPLAEGDYYPGDFLVSVLRVESSFWLAHPSLKMTAKHIADEAIEIPSISKIEREAIREAYEPFISRT